jgi:site-specific DNA recombinase
VTSTTLRRAVAYVRVSKERDDMISPELQMRAISMFATQEGFEIVKRVEDLDLTGTTFDNRSVGQVIEDIRQGEYEAVLLWKWSRWGRHMEHSLSYLRQVEEAGGEVRSATEDIDASTAAGYLSRGLNLLLADFESKQKSEGWKAVQSRRRENGLPHGGAPRFGYRKEGQSFVADPVTGPALREAYERYAAGDPVQRIVDDLNARGIKSTRGNPIKANSLLSAMDSGFAAGLMRSRSKPGRADARSVFDTWHEGAHEALIDRETWEAFQVRRGRSQATPSRLRTAAYSLSGLVRCECGARMVAARAGGVSTWRCSAQQDYKGCPVNGTSARVARLEAFVWQWVQDNAQGTERASEEAERLAQADRAADDVERIAAEVRSLTARRERLVDLYMDGGVDRATYDRKHAESSAELERAEGALREAKAVAASSGANREQLFRSVVETWEDATQHDRRELLSTVIACVRVRKGSHWTPGKYTVIPKWATPRGTSPNG